MYENSFFGRSRVIDPVSEATRLAYVASSRPTLLLAWAVKKLKGDKTKLWPVCALSVTKWPEMSKAIENQIRDITWDLSKIERAFEEAEEEYKSVNKCLEGKNCSVGVPFPDVISKFVYRLLINTEEYS